MGTIHALLTRGKNKGTNGSPGAPGYRYKKGGKVAEKKREWKSKKELLIKFCREEKTQGKLVTLLPGILEKPLLLILGFKKNQILQVLKVGITIQDCNF